MNKPSNLDECFEILKQDLSKEDLDKLASMSRVELIRLHHNLGRWLRNNWGLWHGGPLKNYFMELGLHHADDMYGVIIESFWHHLRNEPLDINKQVKYYQDFWAKSDLK